MSGAFPRTILLLDDDKTTHVMVKGILDKSQALVSCFTIAEATGFLSHNEIPALAIIDRVLPDGDGLAFCTKMRSEERTKEVPVIFLSSKDSETDKVGGLFAGADDYICKPVGPLELKARILARLRLISKKVVAGNLFVDLASHRVYVGDGDVPREVDLTRIEFKMLVTLIQSLDRVFSRDQLLTAVWGPSAHVSDRVVDTHLSHLRKKLGGSGIKIEAIRGEGYRLFLDITVKSQAA